MNDVCKVGDFLWLTDIHGYRHAFRVAEISALRDADEDRTETMIYVHGGRDCIVARVALDRLLIDVFDPSGWPYGSKNRSKPD